MQFPLKAIIFDMDGLLIDSEPFWQEAQINVFPRVGITLTREDCIQTMGIRIDEIVAFRFSQKPWSTAKMPNPGLDQVTNWILDEVINLVGVKGKPLPGAVEAVKSARAKGFKIGLASSSPMRLIVATLAKLGLNGAFDVIHSAEIEAYGKPHPAVYLTTAQKLGIKPGECMAIEDSFTGLLAAKSALMRCMVVPAPESWEDPRLVIADLKVKSLLEFELPAGV